jgi:hypothetical protein
MRKKTGIIIETSKIENNEVTKIHSPSLFL